MQDEISFGSWLRKKRRTLDLSQKAFADQVGCAEVTLRRIEAGTLKPSKELAGLIFENLGISRTELPQWISFARGKSDLPLSLKLLSTQPVSNLPASFTSFVGREQELSMVSEYFSREDIRLITLLGPAGIGKTRLSIEAARVMISEFQDGTFFVTLAPLNDPDLIARTVVQALSFVESGNLPAEKQLLEGIGNKSMLIILDNCEHLIDGVASLAFNLLSGCPHIKIIATSREALRIPGEWLCVVPTLRIPEENMPLELETASKLSALRLFAERARAVRSDFILETDNYRAVSTICEHLDGLPLAIELIAARMRLMSPQALLDRWSGQFILNADGMRSAPERQKTLNHAIRWSYNLLSAEEQTLFASLSVFSGGFTLDAAEEMFSQIFPEKSIPNLIMSLLDKSLLQRAHLHKVRANDRFTMLVTIQEFAWGCLLEMNCETEIRSRHMSYFCALAEQARPQLRTAQQLMWLDRLEDEYGNIRTALKWAQESGAIAEGLRLATDLERFWMWRAHLREPISALEKLLAQPVPDGHIQTLARAHNVVGTLQGILGNKVIAEFHVRESERLCLLLGPEGKIDLAHARLWLIFFTRWNAAREPIQVRQRYDEVLKLFQEAGNQLEEAEAISFLSLDLARSKDFGGARQAIEHSLKLFREFGDNISASDPSRLLAHLALEEGRYAEARAPLEEILLFYRQAGLDIWVDMPLWMLGVIAMRQEDYMLAKEWYKECLLFDQKIGLPRQLAECLIGFAGIASAESQFESGAKLLGAGEAQAESRGSLETFDQIELQRLTLRLRAELGDARFESLMSQGQRMTKEQAITLALESS